MGESFTDFLRDRPFLTLLGVLGAIQDVGLGRFELAGRLQGQLDRVLDDLHRRLAGAGRHDVDHAQRELGDWRVRGASQGCKAAAEGALDAHRIERHDAPVAFDNAGRQGNLLDTGEDALTPLGETEVELSRGRQSPRGPVERVDGLCFGIVHLQHLPRRYGVTVKDTG